MPTILRPSMQQTGMTCIMTEQTPMAVYSFPMDEGDEMKPMCLVFFSPASSITPLEELVSVLVDLEEAQEITFWICNYPSRVEFHFNKLTRFCAELLLVFLSSFDHIELGDWAFMPSELATI